MSDDKESKVTDEALNKSIDQVREEYEEQIEDLLQALEAARNFLPRFAYPMTYMRVDNAIRRHRDKQQK